MSIALAAGVDIGGTNTAVGLVDREGTVHEVYSLPTRAYPDVKDFVRSVSKQIRYMLDKVEGGTLVGIGVGAPNGNHYRGTVEFAPNLSWTGVVPLAQLFADEFQLPTYLDNDANAATAGEMIYGAAHDMRHLIMITLGTGVGSGIVVDGKIVRGHDGFAGEIGHTIVFQDGRTCGCGRRGCLETYASATGVRRTVVERLAHNEDPSTLRDIPPEKLSSKDIYDAAVEGDEIANAVFQYTGRILGIALANAVVFTAPEAIFLFGGLAKAGDMLFNPIREHFEANLLEVYKGKVKLIPSALPDFNAAILGASAMVWRKIKD
jgi:glucokinase